MNDHPYFADDGDEGRCECGYQWYPKGGPVSQRHEQGFEEATSALRAWLAMETVSGPNVVAELRYWLGYWGGTEEALQQAEEAGKDFAGHWALQQAENMRLLEGIEEAIDLILTPLGTDEALKVLNTLIDRPSS